ncbi:alpha/beta hydrolase-fold protein [Nibrella viscosa]|uniref:Alpha/beta hydrolase-fold protein n=1 Tax=Nibrella viscosa TaxID=1084524 RepID=A0ABP8KNP8_9BACT
MSNSLRLEMTTPVHDDRPVFVSGNFCDWYPHAEPLQMQLKEPGRYVFEFPADFSLPDKIEYKYNRGGWDHVELDASGEGVPNRTSTLHYGTQSDFVPHWRWFGKSFNPDFLPNVELISEDFHLPQLDTTRRIQVLLPHDYHTTDKHYPVLYLHDGQNLCGEGSEFGCWEVDKKMALLAARHHHDVILVTIDHGAEERIREFTLHRTKAGQGRGRQYLEFIGHSLKPFVDTHFRTIPDAAHTGMGGSSLGGLISIYAGMLFPQVFGRLMIFSPALWISPKIYFDAIKFAAPVPMKVYAYGGGAESSYMVPNLQRFNDALLRQHYGGLSIDLHVSIDPKGTHQEAHWSREFPKAVEWLFF